jgi:hypothetical protein
MGAAIGGTLGMAAGAFGSEHFGLGATAQHITERLNPFRTMAIRGQQMQSASQDWVTGGVDMNMMSGRGLSGRGATHLGRMLEDTAFSSRFRRETGGAFSAQDLTKITNVAGQQGMLNDTQSVEQIHDRVKVVAKSLVNFMKIANEPNVVEALKSMGRARQMGMSIGETMDMAMEARMYSKMAGQSVSGIMSGAGMQGAMLYQQQGLSAGLGMRMGMGAMGSATAAVGAGAFSPQRLAMLGGVQGVAQREMEMNAAFLKQPMMAMAASTMGPGGAFGVDARATRQMMTGKMDVQQMATRGVDNLLGAVRKQGIGAIAMQEMQSTELQDTIGRIMGPAGTQMARMNQIEAQRKFMGLDRNPGGYAMAGRSLGFSPDDMKQTMDMARSPGYFDTQRRHLQNRMMEGRALEDADFERNRRTVRDRFMSTDVGHGLRTQYNTVRDMGEKLVNFFQEDEERAQAKKRGQVVVTTNKDFIMSDEGYAAAEKAGIGGERGRKIFERNRAALGGRGQTGSNVKFALQDQFLGGHGDDLRQRRQTQGGLAEFFGGGLMERGARLLTGGTGIGKMVADRVLGSAEEIRAANEDTNKAGNVFGAGLSMSGDEEASERMKLKGVDGGMSGVELNIEVAEALGKAARDKRKTGAGVYAAAGSAGYAAGGIFGAVAGVASAAIFGGKTDNRMGFEESKKVAREALIKAGVKDPTDKQVEEHMRVAAKGAAASQGENEEAFRGRETINQRAKDASMAELEAMRAKRLAQMTGTSRGTGDDFKTVVGAAMAIPTAGLSLLVAGAAQGRSASEIAEISAVDKKLFQSGESADAGALAALRLAAEDGDEEAGKKAKALEAELSKTGKGKEVDRARQMAKDLKKSGKDVIARQMGSQLSKSSKDISDVRAIALDNRVSGQAEDMQLRRRTGSEKLTGRSDSEFADMSAGDKLRALAESGTSGLAPKVRELVEQYEEAEGDPDRQKMLEERYSRLETTVGTISERETRGGNKGKGDDIIKDMLAETADTQNEVGKNFPNVDLFDTASQRLLEAARYLNGSGGTSLPSGAITTFDSGGN